MKKAPECFRPGVAGTAGTIPRSEVSFDTYPYWHPDQ